MAYKNLKDVLSFSPEKMKKNNLFETPRLLCDVYCFEPGQAQKVHSHDGQDKIYLVLEGTGTFTIGKEEKELSKETVVLAEGGIDHGVKNTGTGRLTLLVFVAPAQSDQHHGGHGKGHDHHH
jgi:quercetin dioxygenase-like cupin family protein